MNHIDLKSATLGRVRALDALQGNTATAINIVTGREPLVEKNYKITVAKSLLGKGVDFLQTVAGVEFPFSEIPGDYLSNPRNPVVNRPTPKTEAGAILQDVTGVLGQMIGIQRRPKLSRKPSDLMIEYMGEGQKQILFDQLTYSKYAPNYTTTARSQQSTKLFTFADNIAQGAKSVAGVEAPRGHVFGACDFGCFAGRDDFEARVAEVVEEALAEQEQQRDRHAEADGEPDIVVGRLTCLHAEAVRTHRREGEQRIGDHGTG